MERSEQSEAQYPLAELVQLLRLVVVAMVSVVLLIVGASRLVSGVSIPRASVSGTAPAPYGSNEDVCRIP